MGGLFNWEPFEFGSGGKKIKNNVVFSFGFKTVEWNQTKKKSNLLKKKHFRFLTKNLFKGHFLEKGQEKDGA